MQKLKSCIGPKIKEVPMTLPSMKNENVITVGKGSGSFGIAKYNSVGLKLWNTFVISTLANQYSAPLITPRAVTTDASGNIYVTGFFSGKKFDFNPSPSDSAFLSSLDTIKTINNTGLGDAFLAKYAPDGSYLWAFSIGSVTRTEEGGYVQVDMQGNVIITGMFGGSNVDFDPSPTSSYLLSSQGAIEPFVAKYTSGGAFISAIHFSATLTPNNISLGNLQPANVSRRLAIDNLGNVYVGGYFTGLIDLDPGAGNNSYNSHTREAMYLVKLSTSLQYSWGFAIAADTGTCLLRGLGVDAARNVYVTGNLDLVPSQGVDFDPGSGVHKVSSGGIFMAKYDAGGNYVFAQSVGPNNPEDVSDMAVNSDGDFTIVGSMDNYLDIDPGPGTFLITSHGGTDILVACYSGSGMLQNGFTIGAVGSDVATAIASYTPSVYRGSQYHDPIYICGSHYSDVDFDPTYANCILPNNSGYVAKYSDLKWVNTI